LLSWLAKQQFRVSDFHEFPSAHHGDPRCDLRDYRQTVRNKNVSQAKFTL